MKTEFEQILLEAANGHLKSLSDAEFCALTCNLTSLHDGLIRLVYHQACNRKFRAPLRATADFFVLTKSSIIKNLRKTLTD